MLNFDTNCKVSILCFVQVSTRITNLLCQIFKPIISPTHPSKTDHGSKVSLKFLPIFYILGCCSRILQPPAELSSLISLRICNLIILMSFIKGKWVWSIKKRYHVLWEWQNFYFIIRYDQTLHDVQRGHTW